MTGRALLVWLGLLLLAIANGTFRVAFLTPRLGEAAGHVASTLLLSALILGAVWLSIPWIRPETPRAAWAVGSGWLALTVAFEFGAGHYLFGKPWGVLLNDYDLARGRIWLLVLVVTLVSAPLAGTMRHLFRS
jgi:hypothetical protein